MPYIKQEQRTPEMNAAVEAFVDSGTAEKANVGDLNYVLSSIVHEWLKAKGVCYANINAAIGVLTCAKLELYRQIAAPYEDIKKAENGPVSELDMEKS